MVQLLFRVSRGVLNVCRLLRIGRKVRSRVVVLMSDRIRVKCVMCRFVLHLLIARVKLVIVVLSSSVIGLVVLIRRWWLLRRGIWLTRSV